jgi:hypothetical protein
MHPFRLPSACDSFASFVKRSNSAKVSGYFARRERAKLMAVMSLAANSLRTPAKAPRNKTSRQVIEKTAGPADQTKKQSSSSIQRLQRHTALVLLKNYLHDFHMVQAKLLSTTPTLT